MQKQDQIKHLNIFNYIPEYLNLISGTSAS